MVFSLNEETYDTLELVSTSFGVVRTEPLAQQVQKQYTETVQVAFH